MWLTTGRQATVWQPNSGVVVEVMNLTIDIGNTNLKAGLFDGDKLVETWICSSESAEGFENFVNGHPVKKAIWVSTRELSPQVKRVFEAFKFPLLALDKDTPLPIVNGYQTPATLGYDRIAAAVGAYTLAPGCPLLLIDCGTCITYDFVDATGVYRGGNISPGLEMRLKALYEFTSRLPLIPVSECKMGTEMFGNSTLSAIAQGVVRGLAMEMNGYIRSMKEECPDARVYSASQFDVLWGLQKDNQIICEPHLVLKGLHSILQYNSKN